MNDSPLILLVAALVGAYLIGSIPFGLLIGRLRGVDVRTRGSRNIGATNVGRVLGRKWGYLCFALDVLKGFAPVFLVGVYFGRDGQAPSGGEQLSWLGVAFGVVAGHIFSAYLKFRGGKGVATSLGALLGFYPYFTWPAVAALGVWIAVVAVWRYVSLASIGAAAAFPVLYVAFNWRGGLFWSLVVFAVAMAALVIFRHRSNIRRLLAGTENRIGGAKAPRAEKPEAQS